MDSNQYKEGDYLSIREAAKYIGVTNQTLRRWDASGKLKPIRHPASGYRLYEKGDLEPFRVKYQDRKIDWIDEETLERIDIVAKKRGEPRSATINRILYNGIEFEEKFLKQMENPLIRTLTKLFSLPPKTGLAVMNMLGEEATLEDCEDLKEFFQEQGENAKMRQKEKKRNLEEDSTS